jgi:UDP-N-acetylglucosamine--N-acetylmuramyl-(pentapeptide) pyrophosphoryl-undecaprenol N-acetylglucosamine transferase
LVVATGGYVCFPIVMAARLLRGLGRLRPRIVLLEPNEAPGLTTRVLAPIVDEIWGECGGFSPKILPKCRPTGVPVRYRRATLPDRAEAAARLGLDARRKTLLVIGGSQGARSMNDAALELAAANALPSWQLLLIAGTADYERIREDSAACARLRAVPYFDDMADAYAMADAVVARAGASTLAELKALAIPAILVPYPYATDAHQDENARRFAAGGGAVIVNDAGLTPQRLAAAIDEATSRGARSVAADPLSAILERIDALAREG